MNIIDIMACISRSCGMGTVLLSTYPARRRASSRSGRRRVRRLSIEARCWRKPYPARCLACTVRSLGGSRGRHKSAFLGSIPIVDDHLSELERNHPRAAASIAEGWTNLDMAVLGARPFLAPGASLRQTLWEDSPRSSVSLCGCLSSSAGDVSERLNPGGLLVGTSGCSRGRLVVVGRAGGSRPAAGARRPRPQTSRRPGAKEEVQGDGTLLNGDIRVPSVRLLDEDQNMVGVVPTQEAQQRARLADLDLVMISPDADPPVCRIMDYSKYRYEAQKKKREAQKKAIASRQDLKELKMRYNIDTHDYDVRLRAAKKFLKDGDKVKVVCQFKGREMDFKDLAFKLFQRFIDDIGELGLVESKMAIEGRQMIMLLGPNKLVVAKMQATAQSTSDKSKNKGQVNGKPNPGSTPVEEPVAAEEPVTAEVPETSEPETAPLAADT
ncbi:hypothetical protein M758_6G171500 [Ceratodon purpureus]|nr:hypothetical protein M758_6G171500 [Ceratodon purpureus]